MANEETAQPAQPELVRVKMLMGSTDGYAKNDEVEFPRDLAERMAAAVPPQCRILTPSAEDTAAKKAAKK